MHPASTQRRGANDSVLKLLYEALEVSVVEEGYKFEVLSGTSLEVGILSDGILEVRDNSCVLTGAGRNDGLEVAGSSVGLSNLAERRSSSGVVLVEDLCQSSRVGLHALEALSSLSVVALSYLEVTEEFVVVLSSSSLREVVLSFVIVTFGHSYECAVSVNFSSVALLGSSLCQVVLGSSEVAILISEASEVVVSAVILGILFGSSGVDILLLVGIVGEGSSVKEFFYREFLSVSLVLLLDFVIGAANEVVVDGEASATEFGKNFVSEFLVTCREVADLLLRVLRDLRT